MEELFTAVRNKDTALAMKLIKAGANPNAKSTEGEPVLHLAAYRKNAAVVKLLLQKGADPNVPKESGRTPLHSATWQYNQEVFDALLEAGADVNSVDKDGWTPIFMCSNWYTFNALLVRGAKVDVVASGGETLMRRTATHMVLKDCEDGVRMLKKLVELGLKVSDESVDDHGESLLMEVLEHGAPCGQRNSIARFLIDQGMDPLTVSKAGVTALHCACEASDLDMVQLLLEKGADPNARITGDCDRAEEGQRPLDLCESYTSNYKAIKKALLAAGLRATTSKIPNTLIDSKVMLESDPNETAAVLRELLTITQDIKGNVYEHPDYQDPDENLCFIVNEEAEELNELKVFKACVADNQLRPGVQRYVEQIVKFNDERDGEPVYTHEEQEAGGLAMEALLATKDKAYLPLFLKYLESIDIDHTVHLYALMPKVRKAYREDQLAAISKHLDELGFEGNAPRT